MFHVDSQISQLIHFTVHWFSTVMIGLTLTLSQVWHFTPTHNSNTRINTYVQWVSVLWLHAQRVVISLSTVCSWFVECQTMMKVRLTINQLENCQEKVRQQIIRKKLNSVLPCKNTHSKMHLSSPNFDIVVDKTSINELK